MEWGSFEQMEPQIDYRVLWHFLRFTDGWFDSSEAAAFSSHPKQLLAPNFQTDPHVPSHPRGFECPKTRQSNGFKTPKR